MIWVWSQIYQLQCRQWRTSKIVYDEHNHERFPPGDPSKRAFAYFVLTGGRFVYASLVRLLILKFVLSMSASKDVLALASLEVDLSSIEPGTTITVKWWGKPVFIRRQTEEDIKLANSVDVASLCDPQEDSSRAKNPEWLVVIGVCTHLGCIPLPNAGDFGLWWLVLPMPWLTLWHFWQDPQGASSLQFWGSHL